MAKVRIPEDDLHANYPTEVICHRDIKNGMAHQLTRDCWCCPTIVYPWDNRPSEQIIKSMVQ